MGAGASQEAHVAQGNESIESAVASGGSSAARTSARPTFRREDTRQSKPSPARGKKPAKKSAKAEQEKKSSTDAETGDMNVATVIEVSSTDAPLMGTHDWRPDRHRFFSKFNNERFRKAQGHGEDDEEQSAQKPPAAKQQHKTADSQQQQRSQQRRQEQQRERVTYQYEHRNGVDRMGVEYSTDPKPPPRRQQPPAPASYRSSRPSHAPVYSDSHSHVSVSTRAREHSRAELLDTPDQPAHAPKTVSQSPPPQDRVPEARPQDDLDKQLEELFGDLDEAPPPASHVSSEKRSEKKDSRKKKRNVSSVNSATSLTAPDRKRQASSKPAAVDIDAEIEALMHEFDV